MIESLLLFSLGFLTAALLALMLAPPLWRRAVRLTRKRIEATVPLTRSEIQAERDKVRAEAALAIRRMEVRFKQVNDRAATQLIEINRQREEMKSLAAARDERDARIAELEAKIAGLDADFADRGTRMDELAAEIAAATRVVQERGVEIERLGRMYDEASFAASSRQIELVAREGEIETLQGQVAGLKVQRKDLEKRLHEASAALKAERDALKAEKRRVTELERRAEKMLASFSDLEEKIERRDKEIARLRERLAERANAESRVGAELAEARSERSRLRADLAERSRQLAAAVEGDARQALTRLTGERDRLHQRVTTLMRENRRLKEGVGGESGSADLLRDRLQALAAEVVALTARLEGPGSPIFEALGPEPGEGAGNSLAGRIRALLQEVREEPQASPEPVLQAEPALPVAMEPESPTRH